MTSEPDDKQLMADRASTNQRKHRSIERLMSNLVYGDHIGWAAAEFNLVQAGLIKMLGADHRRHEPAFALTVRREWVPGFRPTRKAGPEQPQGGLR